MKITIISFTTSGKEISRQVKKALEESFRYEFREIDKNTFKDKLSNHMEYLFSTSDALVFISSTGIAVRLLAPHIKDKIKDPAVVVVDDLGQYTISLLSGHIGGANALTRDISKILKNQAVITTASDGRGIDAVDTFAVRHNLYIEDMEKAKTLTAIMVEGDRVKLITEINLYLNYENTEVIDIREQKNREDSSTGVILVSSTEDAVDYLSKLDREKPICILRPKNLNIGIGCRRGKTKEEIMTLIENVFKEHNLSLKSIGQIGTIDIKHDEQGIIEVSRQLEATMKLFSKQELDSVSDEFVGSDFVESKVGVRSVCEPAALLLGREMLVSKKILNGVTIAVSRSDFNG